MSIPAGTDSGSHPGLAGSIRSAIERIDVADRHSNGYLTALAFVLHRVAAADNRLSASEIDRMERILIDTAALSRAEAVLTVEMAKRQCRMADCGRAYDASRHLRALLDPAERARVRGFLDAVALADGALRPTEEAAVRQIAIELGLPGQGLRG